MRDNRDIFGHKCSDPSDVQNSKHMAGLEMIHVQINDPVIGKLETCFENIRDVARRDNLITINDFIRSNGVKILLEKLDEILKDRFKIRIVHNISSVTLYGIMPVSPFNLNVLKEDNMDVYTTIKERLGSSSDLEARGYAGMDGMRYDNMFKNIVKATDKLDKILKDSNITVDYDNAIIYGLPNNFIVDALFDPTACFVKVNDMDYFTNAELVAIVLHEVGHQFNIISNTYKTVKNSQVLLHNIKEQLSSKGKSYNDALTISYEKTFGIKIQSPTAKLSGQVAMITITTQFIKDTFNLSELNEDKDNERLADQFASRFGLGSELGSVLEKMHRGYKNNYFRSRESIVLSYMSVGFFILFLLFEIAEGGGILLAITVVSIIVSMILSIYYSYITYGNTNQSPDKYDDMKNRVLKLKHDSVRQLRTLNDKNYINRTLTKIDELDRLIALVPGENVGMLDTIMRFIRRSSAKKYMDISDLNRLVESLQSNDLYIAAAKLKQL
jgi:hypothetical protein